MVNEQILNGEVRISSADNSETIAVDGSHQLTINPRKKIHLVSNHDFLRLISSTGVSEGDEHTFIFIDGTACEVYDAYASSGNFKTILLQGEDGELTLTMYAFKAVYSAALGKWVRL